MHRIFRLWQFSQALRIFGCTEDIFREQVDVLRKALSIVAQLRVYVQRQVCHREDREYLRFVANTPLQSQRKCNSCERLPA